MTIVHRRILYIFFFIVFFITAPLVIMWAQGYKFDWNNRSWQKTGVLFLEVKPKNSDVYLNNKFYGQETSVRIKNLLPNEYEVKVTKEGYIPWIKKLNIYPSITTFAQYVRLFKQDLPTINLSSKDILKCSEMENNEIALITKYEEEIQLQILDSKDLDSSGFPTTQTITNLDVNPENIFLSPSLEKVLIENKNSWLIIDINSKETINLSKFIDLKINNPVFDPDNSDIFYALSDNGLEKINSIVPSKSTLIKDDIISFYIDNNDLFYIKNSSNNLELIQTRLSNPDNSEILSTLPFSSTYTFYPAPNNILNLIDEKHQILYIFDPDTKIFLDKKIIIPEVKYLAWHEDIDSLLFANDYEIWTWQKRDDKYTKNLITRLGTKINHSLWFTFDTHLIFLTNQGLHITEVVSDDNNVIKYEKIKNSEKAFLNKDGNMLFWLTEKGIYQSEIQ
ncbi:MAG: PEGA domain-containing protein [Patescibacteria group bacterium]